MPNKRKIINDPVFGFITIPNDFLYDLLQHPYVQRLNRIRQLGMSYTVYPGAMHTRFLHSLGAFHLMQEAIACLRMKGISVSHEEGNAVMAAILLHDIGHGPFSHVLEHTLVQGISHEDISLLMMQHINNETEGLLNDAIHIFRDEFPRHFLHQMISSQLDMDRLDYLCRDSFFCGVNEGTVASERILKILNVADDKLVIEAKGIYSIEKFLVARRLMYWQVYLHKTSVAAEQMLINILLRAKQLTRQGCNLFSTPALQWFLQNDVTASDFRNNPDTLQQYALLDDSDLLSAIKAWSNTQDIILSTLCRAFTNRQLFKVEVMPNPIADNTLEAMQERYIHKFNITPEETQFFCGIHSVSTDTYSAKDDSIGILYKDGTIKDIADASDMLNIQVLTKRVEKHYMFYYKL
ncbi:MAG: HD domain-containing protein [Prevotella sp.]|nr:HD domain-containing protein [Bacteroidales bacterium]MCM1068421.1 HD domain-containing protein [Prevotella sp.]